MKNISLNPSRKLILCFILILVLVPWPAALQDRCVATCDYNHTFVAFPIVSFMALIFAWDFHTNLGMLICAILVSYLLAAIVANRKLRKKR